MRVMYANPQGANTGVLSGPTISQQTRPNSEFIFERGGWQRPWTTMHFGTLEIAQASVIGGTTSARSIGIAAQVRLQRLRNWRVPPADAPNRFSFTIDAAAGEPLWALTIPISAAAYETGGTEYQLLLEQGLIPVTGYDLLIGRQDRVGLVSQSIPLTSGVLLDRYTRLVSLGQGTHPVTAGTLAVAAQRLVSLGQGPTIPVTAGELATPATLGQLLASGTIPVVGGDLLFVKGTVVTLEPGLIATPAGQLTLTGSFGIPLGVGAVPVANGQLGIGRLVAYVVAPGQIGLTGGQLVAPAQFVATLAKAGIPVAPGQLATVLRQLLANGTIPLTASDLAIQLIRELRLLRLDRVVSVMPSVQLQDLSISIRVLPLTPSISLTERSPTLTAVRVT